MHSSHNMIASISRQYTLRKEVLHWALDIELGYLRYFEISKKTCTDQVLAPKPNVMSNENKFPLKILRAYNYEYIARLAVRPGDV